MKLTSTLQMRILLASVAAVVGLAAVAPAAVAQSGAPSGKATYESTCSACHASGVANAPKFGDVAAWTERLKPGLDALVASAVKGRGVMPPRGGNPKLDDAALKDAISYMAGAALKTAGAVSPAPARAAVAAATPANGAAAAPVAASAAAPATANNFNRLLRAPGRRNLAPTEDNIHDPTNDATAMLQPPLVAFEALPRSNAGNRVDWVKAIGGGHIVPRADRLDPAAQPMVMDLNIVREVKGSMPDVVYPHKQHTEWLDCSNCHPAIFVPQKGANQISMASILLGQKCGVCHGKVAFPVSECKLCHSRKKAAAAVAPAGEAKP
jgi:c(7)-type cytochrome triheme protein